MKRKGIILILCVTMLLSVVACGKEPIQDASGDDSVSPQRQETSEEPIKTEETPAESAAVSESSESDQPSSEETELYTEVIDGLGEVTFDLSEVEDVERLKSGNPQRGDVVYIGEYIYRFNQRKIGGLVQGDTAMNGWSAATRERKERYDSGPLGELFGYPLVNLDGAFSDNYDLLEAPILPDCVTSAARCFYNCTNLVTVSNIPSGLVDATSMFSGCKKLTTVPSFPDTVENMMLTFAHCKSLTSFPILPKGVLNLDYTFEWSGLSGTVQMDCEPTSYTGCFRRAGEITLTGSSSVIPTIIEEHSNVH